MCKSDLHRNVPVVNVELEINGERLAERAAAIPGEDLDWTVLYSVNLQTPENIDRLIKTMAQSRAMTEDQKRYILHHWKKEH